MTPPAEVKLTHVIVYRYNCPILNKWMTRDTNRSFNSYISQKRDFIFVLFPFIKVYATLSNIIQLTFIF